MLPSVTIQLSGASHCRVTPSVVTISAAMLLEEAGGTMADVTFNMIFITDWADYAAINGVYAEYFPGDKPARYCIQCGLVKPDARIEIATIAHVGKG